MATILLYGITGTGKSSFINCLCNKFNEDDLIAAEGAGVSCSTKIWVYLLCRHDILGDLAIMDTVGLNDNTGQCTNFDINKMILEYCFNKKDDYVMDAILYFSPANTTRMNFAHEIKEFCDLFKKTKEQVKQSTIWVLTFSNQFKDLEKLKATIRKINTEHLYILFWDSKEPLLNQVENLKQLLQEMKSFEISTSAYDDDILVVAKALQRYDMVPKMNSNSKTCKIQKSSSKTFVHTENESSYGIFNIISLGMTKFLTNRQDVKREMILPDYPEGALNKSIKKIEYKLLQSNQVCNWVLHVDEKDKDRDKRHQRTIRSEIEVQAVMFGNGKVTYEVTYEYSYDLIEEAGDFVSLIDRHELQYYIPDAKNRFFYQFFNRPKVSRFVDRLKPQSIKQSISKTFQAIM